MEKITRELEAAELTKQDLRKTLDQIHDYSSSVLLLSLQWKDLENHFETTRRFLLERGQELESKAEESGAFREKEKRFGERVKEFELKELIIGERLKKYDLKEKRLGERVREFEARERQFAMKEMRLGERFEEFGERLKRFELREKRYEEFEVKE